MKRLLAQWRIENIARHDFVENNRANQNESTSQRDIGEH